MIKDCVQTVRGILLLTGYLLIFISGNAQEEYAITKYNVSEYVPENFVATIKKDKNGFYWLLTASGYLLRWNGSTNFKVFGKQGSGTRQLTRYYSYDSPDGEVLYYKDYEKPEIYYVDERSQLQPLPANPDQLIAPDFYIGNFLRLNRSIAEIRRLNDTAAFSLFERTITQGVGQCFMPVSKQPEKEYYIINGYKELMYYQKGVVTPLTVSEKLVRGITIGEYFLTQTANHYYLYLRGQLKEEGDATELNKLNWNAAYRLRYVASDSVTYVLNDNRIFAFKVIRNQLQITPYATAPPAAISFNGFYVDDKAKRLILSDLSGGVGIYQKKFYYNKLFYQDPGLNVVYSVLHWRDKIYPPQDFILRIDKKGEKDYNWNAPAVVLNNGNVLYPNFLHFTEFDKNLQPVSQVPFVFNSAIRCVAQVDDQVYFLASGLYKYNYTAKRIDSVPLRMPNGLNGSISYFTKGKGKNLYAIIGNQVCEVNCDNNIVRKTGTAFPDSGNLRVKSIAYDSIYNGLFVVSVGHIFFVRLSTGRVFDLPFGDNLDLLSTHYVLKDKQGDLWLPTNNGLYLLLKEQFEEYLTNPKQLINYIPMNVAKDGIQQEFNGNFTNGGICVGDSVYLSSMNGVVTFSATNAKRNLRADANATILLDWFRVDDSLLSVKDKIYLPAGFKRCELAVDFPFSTLYGTALEYQLTGIGDTSFALVPQNSRITIRALPAGNYKLRVNVVDHPEVQPLELNLVVKQYWYKTILAYVLYFVILAGIILMLLNWRIHRIQNRTLRQIDQNRREMFTIISHDLRTPLKAYQGLADVISYLIKNKDYDKIESVAVNIDSTAAKLDMLMDNLLNWNLLQQEKMMVRNEGFDLSVTLTDHVKIYEELARLKRMDIRFAAEAGIVISADKDLVSLIIRNLMDNAIKNSVKNNEIHVKLFRDRNSVVMQFINVFSPAVREKLEHVKKLMEGDKTWEPGSSGMGFGLRMVHMAAHKNNAKIAVNLEESIVTINIIFSGVTG